MKEKKPKEKNPIMEDIKKIMLKNSIIAGIIIICFVGTFVSYSIMQDALFSRIWQAITMLILVASITFFEVAYKKDSGRIAINGIELLLLACFALTMEYIKTRFKVDIKIYTAIWCITFLLYYLLKMMIIYTSGRKKQLNSLSDIAEIVKEDEPTKKTAIKRKKGEE